MKYCIISDIHGNFEALKKTLEWIKKNETIDGYICCGDIVGYGARPNECIELIQGIGKCIVVPGNHEWASLDQREKEFFNPFARHAIEWTEKELTGENKSWIKSLDITYKNEKFMVVHGSPQDPINEYVSEGDTFVRNLPLINPNLCFIGHTHITMYFSMDDKGAMKSGLLSDGERLSINQANKYLLNCGSVGQPRDKDSRASIGIYDDEKNEVLIRRIEYNIKKTQKEILDAGLPAILAQRLQAGY